MLTLLKWKAGSKKLWQFSISRRTFYREFFFHVWEWWSFSKFNLFIWSSFRGRRDHPLMIRRYSARTVIVNWCPVIDLLIKKYFFVFNMPLYKFSSIFPVHAVRRFRGLFSDSCHVEVALSSFLTSWNDLTFFFCIFHFCLFHFSPIF